MNGAYRDYAVLRDRARRIRRDVVEMVYRSKDGHPSPSMSCADIVAALYFGVMRLRPEEPRWEDRDRLILSKGHACPIVYAALARRGYFSSEILPTLRMIDSKLQGHPDMKKTPGIDATAGSLGNGLSIGLGMAAAAKHSGKNYRTFVIAGDGELQEGIVWEALMAASKLNPGRLVLIVDHNGMQSGGKVTEVSGLEPLVPKLEAFGWKTIVIDGHDMEAIVPALETAAAAPSPTAIVAQTVKGQGVSFMVGDNSWHKRVFTDAEYAKAVAELGD
jgi:transketolase